MCSFVDMYPLVYCPGIKFTFLNITSHDQVNGIPYVFNFCFSDIGECINDVLKIMCRCEVFCLFCKLVTKLAVNLVGISIF